MIRNVPLKPKEQGALVNRTRSYAHKNVFLLKSRRVVSGE